MKFILKPFSEIMIKSKPVRKKQLSHLQTNTNLALRQIDPSLKARFHWDRGEVNTDQELSVFQINALKKALKRIPGIEIALEVIEYDMTETFAESMEDNSNAFQAIFEKAKNCYISQIEGKTFAVRVKRSGKHNFRSLDLEKYIWGGLLQHSKDARVQLKKPDEIVLIEVREDKLLLVQEKIQGMGGYPIGTQDRVLSLISGGFDSGVSTYSMMKRWCMVDYLFFNLWWNAHEIWVKQVAQYLWKTFGVGYKANFITVNFEWVIAELLTKIQSKYRGIILKRLFLQVADMIIQESEYYAIVKGDSLGQVSSQTLKNMFVIDKASSTLVLRPLISNNKQEIVDISKEIGTYNFACNMPEYCWVISDNPATGAKLEKVEKEEEFFDYSVMQKAFEDRKMIKIDQVIANITENNVEVEVVHLPGENEVVIDIREDEKKKKDPLQLEKIDITEIPFFEINHRFSDLDQTKTYLFYCEKGVLSNLHALYLKEKWFLNIKILRPLEDSRACKIK